jgi:hypothetical protein
MYQKVSCKDLSAFGEYRSVAEALFPQHDAAQGQQPDTAAAIKFAEALGIGEEYQRLLGCTKEADELRRFLGRFQNNLDLLIQKTWVEKADELRKGRLLDDVTPFVSCIVQGNFSKAIEAFSSIMAELAYLFFGTQSTKEDFMEYAFRIDEQMGLFWWYGSQLGRLEQADGNIKADEESLRAVLLIGICYLANF